MGIARHRFVAVLGALLLLAVQTSATQAPTPLRGTWTAAVSAQNVFRGTWSADPPGASPNTSRGAWALLDNANRIVLEGTWTATKSQRSWDGTWASRVVPAGRTTAQRASGKVFSGTFRADIKDSDVKTLEGMLRRTLQEQVVGVWRSGGLQGQWSLRATAG